MYTRMAWQGEQAYNTSAKSAHEAKMGGMLAGWRGIPQGLVLTLVPALCYVVLHHPDFADIAAAANGTIDSIVGRITEGDMASTEANTMIR